MVMRMQELCIWHLCKIFYDLVISTCQGQTSFLIPLDLSAAFATAGHGILIEELFQCGIWVSALALLKSYLELSLTTLCLNLFYYSVECFRVQY